MGRPLQCPPREKTDFSAAIDGPHFVASSPAPHYSPPQHHLALGHRRAPLPLCRPDAQVLALILTHVAAGAFR